MRAPEAGYYGSNEETIKSNVDRELLDLMQSDLISEDQAVKISHKSPRSALNELISYKKLLPALTDLQRRQFLSEEQVSNLKEMNAHKSLMEVETLKWVIENLAILENDGLIDGERHSQIAGMPVYSAKRYVQAVRYVDEILKDMLKRRVITQDESITYRAMDPTVADTKLTLRVYEMKKEHESAAIDQIREKLANNE